MDTQIEPQVVDRTISIFEALSDRTEPKGARRHLAQHLDQLFLSGERDPHRLTMQGLSFLQEYICRRDN